LSDNSTNTSNWVQGTVVVSFYEEQEITKTVTCDEEQSQIIRGIIESQNYGEPESFYVDLQIMFNGENYYMDSISGRIMVAAGGYSAVLSTTDLNRIMDLLND